jgi:esterase/lipase superfamily enzyme
MLLVENCAIQQLHSGAVIVAIQKFNSTIEADVYRGLCIVFK